MNAAARLDRIAELSQENESLRAEIAGLRQLLVPAPLREFRGVRLSPRHGAMMALLTSLPLVTRDNILFAWSRYGDLEPYEKTIDVTLVRLRAKLPAGVEIENIRGAGWRLKLDGQFAVRSKHDSVSAASPEAAR